MSETAVALLLVLMGVAGAFAIPRMRKAQKARERLKMKLHAFADAHALRVRETTDRGLVLHGTIGGLDYVVYRCQLRLGQWYFCATAEAAKPLTGKLVVHDRAFPFPSSASRDLHPVDTGDAAFDEAHVIRGSAQFAEPPVLPAEVRNALAELPTPELTVLDGRVSVVWAIESAVPEEREIEAARTILESLAAPERGLAYR